MTSIRFAAVPAIALLVCAAACGKSPESICKKFEELENKSDKKEKSGKKDDLEKCVKDFAKMKETSPEAYACVGKCSDMDNYDQAMACTFACVISDPKLKEEGEKEAKKEEAKREEGMTKWPELAAKTFEGQVKTFVDDKTIKFSVTLAEGFEEEKVGSTESMKSYELKGKDLVIGPNVTISTSFPEELDKAADNVGTILNEKVVKKQKTDKGWVIHTEGEAGVGVTVHVETGETAVECKGRIYDEKSKAHKDKLLPWLEKMCSSLTLK